MTRVLLAVAATLVICAAGCNSINRGCVRSATFPCDASPCCSAQGCGCANGGCAGGGCNAYAGGCNNGVCSAYGNGGGIGSGGFGGGIGNGAVRGAIAQAGFGQGGFGTCRACGGPLGNVGGMLACRGCGIGYGPLARLHGHHGALAARLHGHHGGLHARLAAHHGDYGPTSTPPFAGQSGPSSAQVAYPYYTTRGPRDFLMNNPPTIGY